MGASDTLCASSKSGNTMRYFRTSVFVSALQRKEHILFTHTHTHTHTHICQMQGTMSLFLLRNFFQYQKKLSLLSGSVLICINFSILTYSEVQIVLFLFGKMLIPKCAE